MQVSGGAEEVVVAGLLVVEVLRVLDDGFEVLLGGLLAVEVLIVLDDGFRVLLEDLLVVTGLTVLEILTLLVDIFEVTGGRPVVGVLAQTSWMAPISQAPLILKDSNRMLLMAFRFAPVNELKRTVYVCTAPVIPVRDL